MDDMRADLVSEEGPGGHNWDFWDFHIRRILDWMLEKKEQRGCEKSPLKVKRTLSGMKPGGVLFFVVKLSYYE